MSDTNGANAKKKQTVDLPGFAAFAITTAERLGDGWSVDPDTTSGPIAFLAHPDGRRVGLRRLWRGQAVQTWATDVPPRQYDNEDDAKVMAANAPHLTEGTRYNAGVVFTHNPPAAATAKNIRTRLLPAYNGERPPLRAFPKKRTRSSTNTQTTSAPTAGPRKKQHAPSTATPHDATATPEPTQRNKKSASAANGTATKSTPAKKPQPRRSPTAETTTRAKSRKPRSTKAQPTAPTNTD